RRRTFGALAVVSPHAHAFTTEQVEFLTTVAAQAAVTLEHGRLYTLLRTKGEVRGRLLDQTLQAQENERKHLVEGILDGALQELGDEVVLAVSDDGRGFDAAAALSRHDGMGLHAIREQAELLGGTVRVQSRPGFGTRVEVVLPREASGQREEES